jgi:cell division protease FtsH
MMASFGLREALKRWNIRTIIWSRVSFQPHEGPDMKPHTKFTVWFYLLILAAFIIVEVLLPATPAAPEISYKQFRDRLVQDSIMSVVITQTEIHGIMKARDSTNAVDSVKRISDSTHSIVTRTKTTPWRLSLGGTPQGAQQFYVLRLDDNRLLEDLQAHGVDYRAKTESDWLQSFFLNWVIPFGILFLIWGFAFRRMRQGGQSVLNVGKNKAKVYARDTKSKVTFQDVAGVDEAVEEVKEIVDFLKNPGRYTRLGARLPKGILLIGPPGTGKTLLARAVAGEADVPFFSLSGSDFVEMFVGVGAARVRDLFIEAKKRAPCIIFIDELDAIGKSRARAITIGSNDERENTLNQLLVEMDGFEPGIAVILIAATNRPDVLDPALLRPGRFDRQVLVDKPDMNGREAIFRVHTKKLTLGKDVDLHRLAAESPGFAGAEIANVANEAALLASRNDRKEVTMRDCEEAIERVVAGLEKKNKVINPRERKIIAVHESGHAMVGYFLPGADEVQKVSIVPRGIGALGYTLQMPLEDRYVMSKSELLGKIKGLLGGRAAEEIVFGDVSTGASNDLERVARLMRDMVTVYGMSQHLPNLSLVARQTVSFLGEEPYANRRSEKLEQQVDDEVTQTIQKCFEETKLLLNGKRDLLDKMAELLMEKEVLGREEIETLLGAKRKSPASGEQNSPSTSEGG